MRVTLALGLLALLATVTLWPAPPAPGAQGVDVFLNVTGGGAKKLNIAIPDFALVAGADPSGHAKAMPAVIANDLTFSGLFSVVSGTPAPPPNDAAALTRTLGEFAAAGAHAALRGLLTIRGDRLEVDMRLHDLTSPEHRLIVSKTLELPALQVRRLAHKIADEVVLAFTGELGIADTKIAYVSGPRGAKEIRIADYDGLNSTALTRNGSINLTPVWSPDARSLAYTSYRGGYPDLYRLFPFERRPDQVLAAFIGINTSPAFSPDGKTIAMTLSKDGNPEIYVLTLATGTMRRLTHHAGIDTEPTWSPTGRQLAWISDRNGLPNVYVMDAEGANVRQLTSGGFHTQPRWSPKGDTILYTVRQGVHDLWAVNADGSNPRPLTASAGDNEGATWAPDGRHIAFQSNRLGRWQIFAMLADGTGQEAITKGTSDATSPSWSPRLP